MIFVRPMVRESRSAFQHLRCRCGGWRYFRTDGSGRVVESCDRCGERGTQVSQRIVAQPRVRQRVTRCQNPKCGKRLVRKTQPSGRLEHLGNFEHRRHCDKFCLAATYPSRRVR